MSLNFGSNYSDQPSGTKKDVEGATPSMVVCLCKAVSDRTIRTLVKNGAHCLRDVARACKAGTDCGSCVCQVRELIEQTKAAEDSGEAQDSSLRICCDR